MTDGLNRIEWLVASICLLYPFRLFLNDLARVDLHLGLASIVALSVAAACVVRRRPAGFPTALDVSVLVYLLIAVVDLAALRPISDQTLKGFTVEIRFVVFYFLARLLWLRPVFAGWLLGAMAVIGVAEAVVGLVEYHLSWGWILERVGRRPDRRYWKLGLPRLYSFAMTPLGAAYFLVLALVGTGYHATVGRRFALVAVALVAIWQALPLTLARTALASAVVVTGAVALTGGRRGLVFLAASLSAAALGWLVYTARGWRPALANYAAVGAQLADGSARSHAISATTGSDLLHAHPFGYGFGEAGHLAMARGGTFPSDDTYYLTLGIQTGIPGLAAFVVVIVLAAWLWATLARDRETRALGIAGLGIWLTLASGGLFVASWTMLAPQLYFWLLTGVAANIRATPRDLPGRPWSREEGSS